MNEIPQTPKIAMTNTDNEQHNSPGFPRAILSVSREEFDKLELTVKQGFTEKEGKLPTDLQGHLFIVAPAGTVESESISPTLVVLPSSDGWTPLFNGDGMIYRFDFKRGKAQLKTRLLKTPCYYADRATHQHDKFKHLRFKNFGYGRLSFDAKTGIKLGVRNQLNTALIPFKFSTDAQERLLVTWDTGRPYEVDPQTLELIAPIGWNKEWKPVIDLSGSPPPFPQVMTSAHPCFDPQQDGEIFTVNVGKSLSTILWLSRSLKPKLKKFEALLKSFFKNSPFKRFVKWFSIFLIGVQIVERFFNFFSTKDFVCLKRWNGKSVGDFDQWKVVRDIGFPWIKYPVKIRQTLHQMGITRDHIILADSAFKFDLTEAFPYKNSEIFQDVAELSIDLLDYPQMSDTYIYIVRRADLKPSQKTVKARQIKIPLAMAHYLVDYENSPGKITLHAAHICATDPSETIRDPDRSVYSNPEITEDLIPEIEITEDLRREITEDLRRLAGTVCGPMDISRLGCHVIDVKTGEVQSNYADDIHYTWTTAFYAYRDEMPTKKFEDIYWNSWGCWRDILSNHVFSLYKDYDDKKRQVSVEKVLELTLDGIPSSLSRLHIERSGNNHTPTIKLQDHYQFPKGYLGTSAQFVPKAGKEGSTAGYIVCVVIKSNNFISDANADWSSNSEIWIFDAQKANFGGEPLCRLSHPQLNFGFTLHTTWLPPRSSEAKPRANKDYRVRDDYEWLVEKQPEHIREKIKELFEHHVYPKFDE